MRHIVCVSDIHAGSTVAVCPPECPLDDGGVYRYSRHQAVLWRWWREFWRNWVPRVTRGERYALVINGDVLEGKHHETTTIISANMSVQQEVAYRLLEPIVRDRRVARTILVRGTEAHAGRAGEQEVELAERLGIATAWDIWLSIGDRLVHFAHHIGTTSSSAYESSALMRELVASYVEAGQWNERRPDLVVRSHRHRYCRVEIPTDDGAGQIVVTPGWQLHTPFTYRASSMRLPQIGGICITADGDELIVRRKIWAPRRRAAIALK